jgi:elongation factor G
MDWMEEEKLRGITITSAATTCYWKEGQINIIDTPGHIDFTGEVERSLRILDGAVMIFSAVEGVESQSEAVWRQADKYMIPRIVYINKLDRVGADPNKCINMIKERLSGYPLEVQFPIGIERNFYGVCDIIENKVIEWEQEGDGSNFTVKEVPENLRPKFQEKRNELLEAISLEDDNIAEAYLHDKFINKDELVKVIRKLTIKKNFVPIFFGASARNIGVQPLLDGIINYLPSPLEIPIKEEAVSIFDHKFCALVFKTQTDPHGKLVYIRIYSGSVKPGAYILNHNTHTRERISQIFLMHANKRQILREARAGDIVAIYGPKNIRTGDTLTSIDSTVKLRACEFPEPVIFAKIEPKTSQDEEKFYQVLNDLSIDDPTIDIKKDPETGETLIGGMGELHLQILSQRMEREFSLNVRLGSPQVAYKETIVRPTKGRGQFIKQTGGKGQYGDVMLEIFPLERGKGFKFKSKVKTETIPKEYWSSIHKGIESGIQVGLLAGFPVVDIKVVLVGGSYHPVDSSNIAFESAASIAVKEALKKAELTLLEPEMKLEIVVPPEYLGNVLDDLSKRGGKVLSLSGSGTVHTILASCPLRKLFGYATVIRSLTQGRAVHVMKFDSYKEVPPTEQSLVLKKIRGY